MGREKDPFQRRGHSQDGRRRGHEDEYDLEYEDEYEFDEDVEADEYEVEDMFDERGPNVPRRRSATSLPPFPSTNKNINPRRLRASRMPRSTQSTSSIPPKRPTQTTRSKRQAYLPEEPQPLPRHYSTRSYHRPVHETEHLDDDFPRRPVSARPVSPKPRKRRVWPIFLVGCAAGAVSLVLAIFILALVGIHSAQNGLNLPGLSDQGKAIAGQPETQTVPLSALSQLIVLESASNIPLGVYPSPGANKATNTKKKTTLHWANQK